MHVFLQLHDMHMQLARESLSFVPLVSDVWWVCGGWTMTGVRYD